MKMTVTVEGLQEAIKTMQGAKRDIPAVLEVAMTGVTLDLKKELQHYPDQAAPRNPKYLYKRGEGTLYVPTGHMRATSQNYGRSTTSNVAREGTSVVGYVNSKASYSIYLRGDLDGKGPAWMHKDTWEPVSAILERKLPGYVSILETAVADYIEKA